jgi:hypothetical protein
MENKMFRFLSAIFRLGQMSAPTLPAPHMMDAPKGSILVFTVPKEYSESTAAREGIASNLQRIFKESGVRALVIPEGMTLGYLVACDGYTKSDAGKTDGD